MIRVFIFLLALATLAACSDKNKNNTTYTIITDHYSSDSEGKIRSILSIEDYSPCPNLSISTYNSRIIRTDLAGKNETKVINKSFFEKLSGGKLQPNGYTVKLSKFIYPENLKEDAQEIENPKNLEYYINSFNTYETRVYGLNSLGIENKGLDLYHSISHFQNEYDLKDALSDYICNEIGIKNVVILLNLYHDTSIDDCLAGCEALPEDRVCADDGNEYRNIECLNCYPNLKIISCNKGIPVFKKELLTEKAFEMFYKFAEAQELIANNRSAPVVNDLIDNTMRLFEPNSKVEILNLGSRYPISFTTKKYLDRLRTRPFDEVKIEWDQDWEVLSDWTDAGEEIPQSEMTAEGKQIFRGSRKNLVVYSDAIKKNVNFKAKLIETIDEDGNEVVEWKVYIGNIKIASKPSEL